MELRLANAISKMLLLGFKFFFRDIEYFFSSVHFLLQFLPTKWNSLGAKMQFSNTCGAKVPINENIVGGGKGLQIGELDLVMNRLEVLGLWDDSEKMSFLGEEGLIGLFDEEEPSFEEIKETFGVFDVNKDGFIDAIELQRVLCKLGLKESCSLEECKRMIKSCDCNGDGVIDLNEFVKFMEKCLC